MQHQELIDYLKTEGYDYIYNIQGKGICGIYRFAFTWGLVVGMTEAGYKGRYCYSDVKDALNALIVWITQSEKQQTVVGDPDDEHWIKYKGNTEYHNPKNKNIVQ